MRHNLRFCLGILIVLLPIFFAGCSGGNDSVAVAVPVNSMPRTVGALEFTVSTTRATFARGEQVPLTFSVRNIGTSTVHAILGACDYFDVRVSRGNQVIWQLSRTHGCGGLILEVAIAPGETKTYTSEWPQTDQDDNPVPAGQYTITTWYQPYDPGSTDLPPGNQEVNESANPIQISVTP
jgi:hypothetical protein